MESIGQRIKRLRIARGFTRQVDFAPMVYMKQSSLSDVESKNKEFNAIQLLALCRVLQVSPEYIVYGGEEEDMGTIEIVQLFKSLGPHEREMILKTARALQPQANSIAA